MARRLPTFLMVVALTPATGCDDGVGDPSLLRVEPAERSTDEATQVTIVGRDLVPLLAIDPAGKTTLDARFRASIPRDGDADLALTDVRFVDTEHLTATVPAGLPKAGRYALVVHTPSGARLDLADAFASALVPLVERIDPIQAPTAGNLRIDLHGEHFVPGTTVSFGQDCPTGPSTELSDVRVVSEDKIQATVPPADEGFVDVFVTSEFGTGCKPRGFFYVPPTENPVVRGIEPAVGPSAGGIPVVISADNLRDNAVARVGDRIVTGSLVDTVAGTITGTLPANSPGEVSVKVEVPGVGSGILVGAFRYVQAPQIDRVSPEVGPQRGGTTVLVRGAGFIGDVEVRFGDRAATNVRVASEDELTCETPSGRGLTDVTVLATGGEGLAEGAFTYSAPPTVTSVEPVEGRAAGGDEVVVRGSGFDVGGVVVTIGGNALLGQTVEGPGEVRGRTAPGSGLATVAVASLHGVAFQAGAWRYVPPPRVDRVTPAAGRPGADVAIEGAGFLPDTSVTLGGQPLEGKAVTPNRITGRVPDVEGLADLAVEHAFGAVSVEGAFYVAPEAEAPRVDEVHPAAGPDSGGTSFWIRGSSLPPRVGVWFGDAAVTDAAVLGDSAITGTVPAGTGTVDVTVEAGGARFVRGAAWRYVAGGVLGVSAVRPASSPAAGGVPVVVTGSGFDPQTRALVGGAPLIDQRFVHAGELRGVLPAGTGEASVMVLDPDGDRAAGLPSAVRYGPDGLDVGSVWPARGPAAGGTPVRIRGVGLGGVVVVRFGDDDGVGLVASEDGTAVDVVAPAGLPGTVDVRLCEVANCSGAVRVPGAFTRVADGDAVSVDAVWPGAGPEAGGTEIAVVGGPFPPDAVVRVGGEPLAGAQAGAAVIRGDVPPGSADADVVVTWDGGGVVAPRAFRYLGVAPTVASIDPEDGPARGGPLTVRGTGFVEGVRVFVGDVEMDVRERSGDGLAVSGDVPPGPPGAATVRVETPHGSAAAEAAYTRGEPDLDDPTPLEVLPTTGAETGGAPLLVRGEHLDEATRIRVGASRLTNMRARDSATAVGFTPAGEQGARLPVVAVTLGGGEQTLLSAYAYLPLPEITSVEPRTARQAGGDVLRVEFGPGVLTVDTLVDVGGLRLEGARVDVPGRVVTGDLPPGVAGEATVRAFNAVGAFVSDATVDYLQPPEVDTVDPPTGLPGGGNLVALEGRGFDLDTTVMFGNRPAAGLLLRSPVRLEATAPPGFGTVDLVVESGLGRSVVTDGFTYVSAPRLYDVAPRLGRVAGGTEVRLRGEGFGPGMGVTVGDQDLLPPEGADTLLGDARERVGRVPAAEGTGWVAVAVGDHRGQHSQARGFRYVEDVQVLDESSGAVHAVVTHGSGTAWVGTAGGLRSVDVVDDSVASVTDDAVRGVLVEPGGVVVSATAVGLQLCDLRVTVRCRTVDERDVPGLEGALDPRAVVLLADGRVLTGGPHGAVRVDPATADVPVVLAADLDVRDLAVDDVGDVWVAAADGLARLDAADLALERIGAVDGDEDVRAIAIGEGGDVWIGTSSGLVRHRPDVPGGSPDAWATVEGMPRAPVHDVDVGHDGRVWVAAAGGLAEVDPATASVVSVLRASDGLPSGDVLSVHAAPTGGIYVGTAEGLARYAAP